MTRIPQQTPREYSLRALFRVAPEMELFMQKRGLLRGMGGSGEVDGRPEAIKAIYTAPRDAA
jgi:hypothetical protein